MTTRTADPGVNFRLSRDIWPIRYDLQLDLDLDAWRHRGTVAISLDVRAVTETVTLHALDLTITAARIERGAHDVDATGTPASAVTVHPAAESVTLAFPTPITPGTWTLHLAFEGEILEKLRGLYRSTKDGQRFAATQFEAADARRAFPCFDEPEYKARFHLTLEVPGDAEAIANGEVFTEESLLGGRKRVRFRETPPISSYLVAFLVGPFEATDEVHTNEAVPVRVWLPRGLGDKGLYARDAHRRAVEYLAAYTGIPYPYGKIDAIGLPDFEAGAMENPGAITYRLTAIAADPAEASTDTLKDIFYTAAHELTHMWWGDLVTMAWWNDLWLNESFATFVGWKATAELNPEWGMWRDFVATLARPFALDALVSTHPISFQVENARQAAERFDVITYWKGAGVVRMIERFLGSKAFQAGVQTYLRKYAERNATADDFWRELDAASGRDVTAIANAWIREPGHPVVEIASRFDGTSATLTLRQRRFFSDPEMAGAKPEQRWPVPLVLKIGTATGVREERVILAGESLEVTLAGASWVYPNGGGAGFYRFALDDAAIARLAPAIASGLAPEERLNLIGNQWALLKAGVGTVASFLTLVRGFAGEHDRAVLEAISQRLAWLENHVLADGDRAPFGALIREIFAPELAMLGWDAKPDEPVDLRVKRAAVIGALGHLAGDAEVLAEARRRLESYLGVRSAPDLGVRSALELGDRSALEPNLVPVVANLVAKDGDASLWERFLERKRQSAADDPEEEERFLYALASFEDPELIPRTLHLTYTDDVRPQDRAFVLSRLLGARASRQAAWEFVRDGWDTRVLTMDPMLRQYVIRGMATLTPAALAGSVAAFLAAKVTDDTRETTAQAGEQLRIDAAAVARMQLELPAALGSRSSHA